MRSNILAGLQAQPSERGDGGRSRLRGAFRGWTLALVAAACSSQRTPASRLMDVSGDDCTASALVYDAPPASSIRGTPFINDGCSGDRILFGIDGTRRELTRPEDVPLGEGGPYSDAEYRVSVVRGPIFVRDTIPAGDESVCNDPSTREYESVYQARVLVRSAADSFAIDGALTATECSP